MLSRVRISVPQRGQAERGATMDRLSGVRWTTTVRNDPNTSPKSANDTSLNAAVAATSPRLLAPANALPDRLRGWVRDLAEERDVDVETGDGAVPGDPDREEAQRV